MFTLNLPECPKIKELIISNFTTEMECRQPSCRHRWSQRGNDLLFAATVSVSTDTTLCKQVEDILDGTWEKKPGCCPQCSSKGKCTKRRNVWPKAKLRAQNYILNFDEINL